MPVPVIGRTGLRIERLGAEAVCEGVAQRAGGGDGCAEGVVFEASDDRAAGIEVGRDVAVGVVARVVVGARPGIRVRRGHRQQPADAARALQAARQVDAPGVVVGDCRLRIADRHGLADDVPVVPEEGGGGL